MDIEECYRELGLEPGSSDADVKDAWRRLAARFHPDRNASPHALRRIQRINRAVAEIRRVRSLAGSGEDAAAQAEEEPAAAHTLTVSLEEACAGCVRQVQGELVAPCDACGGSGEDAAPTECSACAGSGRMRPHLWFAWMTGTLPCEACSGQGRYRAACTSCEGKGQSPARKYRARVQVPAGSMPGTTFDARARLQGRAGGELRLRVRLDIEPHPLFTLDADGTVKCEVPVDGFAWMAQQWIDVPTPRGLQQMRLRRSFTTYRIKGEGLRGPGAQAPADCMVTVAPLFPDELTDLQRSLVDALVASNTGGQGTAAAGAMGRWKKTVADWQDRQSRGGSGAAEAT